ncbi:MauE/DoxX family redox-associated membrane protein [Fluviicola sp.]|uniref:MauE/DoxX family redox-associated membrane protein n=1 Tax=Fluviicola sp. TaxID=1917219 RepID=UPI0031E444FE
MKTKNNILTVICILFALIWGFAGLLKIIAHEAYYDNLIGSAIYRDYADILFYLLPTLEILAGMMLFWKRTLTIGLSLTVVLFGVYTAFNVYILLMDNPPCSCHGFIKRLDWKQHLIVHVSLLVLALLALGLHLQTKFTGHKIILPNTNIH